jgi:hypothetical protein
MFGEDVSVLSREELERELREQAAHVDAGVCRLLELAAECERRLNWSGDGTSFAAWLAWRCSLSARQAREFDRIGKRLGELPLIHAAFSRGELSFAKVSVLVGVAAPDTERELVGLAEVLTASQLGRCVGAYRRLAREQAADQQQREFLHYVWAEEGWLSFRGRLAAEEGALLVRALEAGRDALWDRRRLQAADAAIGGTPDGEPARPSNAEALAAVCDLALTRPEADRPAGDRYQVVVHVDVPALAADADGRCELADGAPVAVETARRLSCDGSVVALVEREGKPLSVGRKRRTIPPALRRALAARDRGCRFPGCDRTRFVDGHHIRHWSRGGDTSLDNLLSLCRRHHRLVHERGYTVTLDEDGEARFVNEYGVAIPTVPRPPPPSDPQALPDRHRRLGLRIDKNTCRNGHGDRMDLSLAVDAIISIAG